MTAESEEAGLDLQGQRERRQQLVDRINTLLLLMEWP